jgi:hypothetical protein
VRLYDRRVVRFRASAVHDSVVTDRHRYGKLHGPLHHFSMRSFEDMKRKLNERTWLSVDNAYPSKIWLAPRLITEMPLNFLKYYFTRGHFTGGTMGLKYAGIHAWYRFLKVYRMWHRKMPDGGGAPAVTRCQSWNGQPAGQWIAAQRRPESRIEKRRPRFCAIPASIVCRAGLDDLAEPLR